MLSSLVDHGEIISYKHSYPIRQQKRHLSVHEYVSMTLLRDAEVPTPKFGVAKTPQEASDIARQLDCLDLVVKAQVGDHQAGGHRGF